MNTPLLECRNIVKRFGGVTALAGVDFSLSAGEVHGLVGSNGAGKSTLMKILAGALPDFEGSMLLDGRPVRLSSPLAALNHGIAMVYQELSGIGSLSVAENLFLGRQPTAFGGRIDWRAMRSEARQQLAELKIDVDVNRRLDSCSLAIRQMVEVARGIHSGARILILDEPTSALSPPEASRLFELVRRLGDRGVGIVFISHFIEDVLEICDRITVLRNGRRVATRNRGELDKREVVRLMLGRGNHAGDDADLEYVVLPPRTTKPPVLRAAGLSLSGTVVDVSLEVSPGECLGLYGFAGSGHREIVHILGGALAAASGNVLLDDRALTLGDVHQAVRRGVVLVTGDRAQGLFLRGEIYKNITLPHLRQAVGEWLTFKREASVAQAAMDRVGCRPAEPRLLASQLSGGNQQKVMFARWLLGPIRVLLLDEPTRGMDVSAKAEVMGLVVEMQRQGAAVVLASAEPELLLAHADRILVIRRGRVAKEWTAARVDKAALMQWA